MMLIKSWKPIDTAPKDGSTILLYKPKLQFVGNYSNYFGWIINAPSMPQMNQHPTHWTELPQDPD